MSASFLISFLRKASWCPLYLSIGHSLPCYTGLTNTSLNRIPSLTDHYQNFPLSCFKTSQHTISLESCMDRISCYSFPILTTVSPFLMQVSYTSPSFGYVPSVRYCKHIVFEDSGLVCFNLNHFPVSSSFTGRYLLIHWLIC